MEIRQTPDTHQTPPTDLLPVQEGLASGVHSVFRIADSITPCAHTFDGPSETKQITGVVSPPEAHLYRSRAALVFLLSTHPAARLPGLAIAHVRPRCVLPPREALHHARQQSVDAIATISPEWIRKPFGHPQYHLPI